MEVNEMLTYNTISYLSIPSYRPTRWVGQNKAHMSEAPHNSTEKGVEL